MTWIDGQIGCMNGCMDRVDGWMDRVYEWIRCMDRMYGQSVWMNGMMDTWMVRWMNGWIGYMEG